METKNEREDRGREKGRKENEKRSNRNKRGSEKEESRKKRRKERRKKRRKTRIEETTTTTIMTTIEATNGIGIPGEDLVAITANTMADTETDIDTTATTDRRELAPILTMSIGRVTGKVHTFGRINSSHGARAFLG